MYPTLMSEPFVRWLLSLRSRNSTEWRRRTWSRACRSPQSWIMKWSRIWISKLCLYILYFWTRDGTGTGLAFMPVFQISDTEILDTCVCTGAPSFYFFPCRFFVASRLGHYAEAIKMRDSAKETLEAPAIRTSSKRWRSVHQISLVRSRRLVMVIILGDQRCSNQFPISSCVCRQGLRQKLGLATVAPMLGWTCVMRVWMVPTWMPCEW